MAYKFLDSTGAKWLMGKIKEVSSALTTHAENKANPHGVTAAQVGALPKDTIMCNPNLLDNWFFGNPVNQRGKNSYSGEILTIDRWRARWTGDGTTSIASVDGEKCIAIHRSSYSAHINQNIPVSSGMLGARMCASLLGRAASSNGSVSMAIYYAGGDGELKLILYSQPIGATKGVISVSFTVPASAQMLSVDIVSGEHSATAAYIYACKLEIGDTQTLAHEENGKWVLNEIPDYGEQLRRCQRYYWKPESLAIIRTYGDWWTAACTFPITMRTTPSAENLSVHAAVYGSFETDITIGNANCSLDKPTSLYIQSFDSSVNAMDIYGIAFSADL